MRLNELGTGLLAVLVLLLLLDSSSAQPHPAQAISKGMVAKKKITDPHYRHQQQHGGYGSSYTAGYGYQAPAYSEYNKYGGDPSSKGYGGDPYKLPYKPSYTKKAYRDAYDDEDYYKKSERYGDDYYKDSYDSYDTYGSGYYGKKKQKHKRVNEEVQVSTKVTFDVSACNAKYPGVERDADTTPAMFTVKPTAVMAWWRLSCTRRPRHHNHKGDDYGKDYYDSYDSYGGYAEAGAKQQQAAGPDSPSTVGVASSRKNHTNYGSYGGYGGGYGSYGGYGGYGGGGGGTIDNIGQCWAWGLTETGIEYKSTVDGSNFALVTYMCEITNEDAKECDPGLAPVEGSVVTFGGTLRILVEYNGATASLPALGTFDVTKATPPSIGMVTGVYTGQAGVGASPITDLPLRRYNTGAVTVLDLNGCKDAADPDDLNDDTPALGSGTFEVKFTI